MDAGVNELLRLVVRRIVVGSLGTGSIERRFGDAAKKIHDQKNWSATLNELADLNPSKIDFEEQIQKRSYNKNTLTFLRRSILQKSTTPAATGTLHFIRPRQSETWPGFSDGEDNYWAATIGNTILATAERRPKSSGNWDEFKENLLTQAVENEWTNELSSLQKWTAQEVCSIGRLLSEAAANVWY